MNLGISGVISGRRLRCFLRARSQDRPGCSMIPHALGVDRPKQQVPPSILHQTLIPTRGASSARRVLHPVGLLERGLRPPPPTHGWPNTSKLAGRPPSGATPIETLEAEMPPGGPALGFPVLRQVRRCRPWRCDVLGYGVRRRRVSPWETDLELRQAGALGPQPLPGGRIGPLTWSRKHLPFRQKLSGDVCALWRSR